MLPQISSDQQFGMTLLKEFAASMATMFSQPFVIEILFLNFLLFKQIF